MYLFFDTETTGVPKNYKALMSDLNNWPRVIQLAFIVYDKDKNIVTEFCQLIKPNGWVVPNERFWIENGFSTEKNNTEGVDINFALDEFIRAIDASKHLIAHNIDFDYKIMGAEMMRADKKATQRLTKNCTMQSGTNLCQIINKNKTGYKWPKLVELHQFLFNEGFSGAHDALSDVKATARCFFEMQNRKIFSI